MKKINIKTFWDVKDTVLLAISGGVDSMVLLDVFCTLPPEQKPHLVVACVNHGMRENAFEEVALVRRICQKHAIPFFTNDTIPTTIVSELAAREFRYQFFEDIAQRIGARYLVTAHHRDDQSETVLMKWIRGEFLTSLKGIAYKRQWTSTCELVRPLLRYDKSDLQHYAQQQHLSFLEDDSNASTMYFRNRVRHHIIPLLQDENPNINTAIESFVDDLSDVLDVVAVESDRVYPKVVRDDRVHKATLLTLPRAVQKQVLMMWLTTHDGLSRAVLTQLLALVQQECGEKTIYISDAKQCVISYEWIMMTTEQVNDSADIGELYVSESQTPESVACISLDQQPFAIRTRKTGDTLLLEKYKKKVSRIFIDEKIPAYMRDTIPVVVDKNDQVIAILHSELVYLSKRQETGKIYTHYLNYRKRERL